MKRETASQKAMARIARYLFYNPWSTTAEISGFTNLPVWRVQETLVDYPRAFERLSIPWEGGNRRTHSALVTLTSWGQRKYLGLFRAPSFLASALLMHDRRLSNTRRLLLEIKRAKRLNWLSSPWKARRKGILFDAIASLSVGPKLAILGVFAYPPAFASLPWYEQVIKEWIGWRNKGGNVLPANLYICHSAIENRTVAEFLAGKVEAHQGNIIVFESGKRARWQSLTNYHQAAVPDVLLSPEGFTHLGVARYPYARGRTLRAWAEANREDKTQARQALQLIDLCLPQIGALETIALHPPATIKRLRAGSRTVRERNQMHSRVRTLGEMGLVFFQDDEHATITITQEGISLLGALHGIEAELADELLGWPNRPATYAAQPEHYQRITSFMLWLHQAGRMENWSTMKCRYRFRGIASGAVHRHSVTIHPDGEGDFLFSDGRKVRFWLEVDRGTRYGTRFSAQLERYYLIRYARISPINIPALLYVIDTGEGRDEGRLHSAARRLAAQARSRYPQSTLHILFTTADLIDRFTDQDPGNVKIWRRFYAGQLDGELVSLEAGLLPQEGLDK